MEEWKEVIGFPNYEVSNLGRVKSKERTIECLTLGGVTCKKVMKEKILKPHLGVQGYYIHSLRQDTNKPKFVPLHRIIAMAFIPNPDNKPEVDHIDRNKQNNSINNLRWATKSENQCNRPSRTNEPYIHLFYKVAIPGQKPRCFATFEEAITYRDSIVKVNLASVDS